ncbi:MAG TPA: dihydrolipoamide acetyltransferase family protein, partial [Pirellulales bacterium]
MPTEITVPRLGWSMEEGTLTEWLKQDGQWVDRGEMLFVLEGDKAAQEIESFESGVLRIPPNGPRPGDSVKVGQVIGYLVEQGAPAPFEQPDTETPLATSEPAEPLTIAAPPPAAGPAARRLARELGVDLAHVTGSGRGGRILAADVRQLVAGPRVAGPRPNPASPRARRISKELGVDWTGLQGTGRGGRVRERDVRAAAQQTPPTPSPSQRRTIADRMVASLRSTAQVTLTSKASATNLLNLRSQFKTAAANADASLPEAAVPSVTDLLVKLAAAALAKHPGLHSRWEDNQIVESAGIHIGVAVDAPSGLIVPVIRDVPALGLRQLAARLRELVEKARSRRLTADEMSGGTFTITNLGMFGIDAFTPILNSPQTA